MPEFDVVELPAATPPATGEEAPDFTRPLVTDEFWEDRSLSSLLAESEGRTILVFTPMIGSFPGTYVWEELAERNWDEGVDRVVGITAATPYAVSSFLDGTGVPFSIFADPANDVADRYGVAHDLDGMTGISEPRPAFVVLEADGTVAASWVASEWPEFPEYDELETQLGLETPS
ncbi:peroxiredoxin [Salinadaptatus halalkaliphilus]|uniref:Peroxiredoxin n=1 Tax=Salinadaptatus halalkaliphilus TaxID=2419781 RepID=A0A4S3TLL5_9EURY|nr:redoxin domain-containing protein [Salinadaptatus halalkaliphilus]THE65071.1 peroxiredoxin [Salinadaptatus halalkaliphilus]